jgi:SAM-dependent methyltransferase
MTSAPVASRSVLCDACPLCGSASWDTFFDGGPEGFEWVRCDCSAVYKRTGPARAAPAFHQDGHYDAEYFARYERRRRRRVAKARRQILDAIEVAPPGRLLDVGCSLGYALEAARSLGIEASGVDVSAHAVEACTRLGFDAHLAGLDALPFEDASFAVVLLKHVFEHTPTPRSTLAELRRVLVPGGAAFFAVPNLEYFKARRPETSRFFRGEAAEAHYVYYTPATLSRLVEKEGLRVASVHSRMVHRRASLGLRVLETLVMPVRAPLRALSNAAGLRKEFWLVAVRA